MQDGNIISSSDAFLYVPEILPDQKLIERLKAVQSEEKVLRIPTSEQVNLGGKVLKVSNCYYVNEMIKVNEENIFGIMLQLTDEENDANCVKELCEGG